MHNAVAHPISAAFRLRYLSCVMRRWAASRSKVHKSQSRHVAGVIGGGWGLTIKIGLSRRGAALLRWQPVSSSPTAPRRIIRQPRRSQIRRFVQPRVVAFGEPCRRAGAPIVGKPYTVAGRVYVPEEDPNYRAEGMAFLVRR